MKKMIHALLLLCLLMLPLAGCGPAKTEKTSGSEEGALPFGEDARVVAATVGLAEILVELGVPLVGVPNSAHALPQEVAGAARIGYPMSPNLEMIKSLEPTVVVAASTLAEQLKSSFESADIPVIFADLDSLEGMRKTVEELGAMFDRREEAALLLQKLTEGEAEAVRLGQGKQVPTILLLFGAGNSFMAATDKTYVGDLAKRLGAVNIVDSKQGGYVSVNLEAMAAKQPDIILRMTHGLPEEAKQMFEREFTENPVWRNFSAVQKDRVYDLNAEYFGTAADLKAMDALRQLGEILYRQ